MDKRTLGTLFLIVWVAMAFAGTVSLVLAVFAGSGSVTAAIMDLLLFVIFFLLWRNTRKLR